MEDGTMEEALIICDIAVRTLVNLRTFQRQIFSPITSSFSFGKNVL